MPTYIDITDYPKAPGAQGSLELKRVDNEFLADVIEKLHAALEDSGLTTMAELATYLNAVARTAHPTDTLVTSVGAGAIPITKPAAGLDVSGPTAFTLADGVYIGQTLTFFCASNTGGTDVGTVTPATPYGYSTITVNAVAETATVRWLGAAQGWGVVGVNGATVVP